MRALGWLLVTTFFAFGLLLLALRYWLLPDINAMRPRIEAIASSALKAPVTIGRIEASWHGLNPVLALDDVKLSGASGGAVLALPRIEGTLSWTSVPTLAPRFSRLRIHAPELEVALLDGGAVSIAGIVIDPQETGGGGNRTLDCLLAQRQLLIRDARVRLRDERVVPAREIVFSDADFLLESGFGTTASGCDWHRRLHWLPRSTCVASSIRRHSDASRTSGAGAANCLRRLTMSTWRSSTSGCRRRSTCSAPTGRCVRGYGSMQRRWSAPRPTSRSRTSMPDWRRTCNRCS